MAAVSRRNRRKTYFILSVKNRAALVVGALMIAGIGSYFVIHSHAYPAAASLFLNPPQTVTVGQTFDIPLTMEGLPITTPPQSDDFTLMYDSSYLQLIRTSCNTAAATCIAITPDPADPGLVTAPSLANCVAPQSASYSQDSVSVFTATFKALRSGNVLTKLHSSFYGATCSTHNNSTWEGAEQIPGTLTSQDPGTGGGSNTGGGGGGTGTGGGGTGQGTGGGSSSTSSSGPGSSGSSSKAASSSSSSSANSQSTQPNSSPMPKAQGTQTNPPEQQPSPFFDGKEYSPGSDSSVISSLVPSHHAQSWIWYIGWSVALVFLAGGGYVWWRRWQLKPKAK